MEFKTPFTKPAEPAENNAAGLTPLAGTSWATAKHGLAINPQVVSSEEDLPQNEENQVEEELPFKGISKEENKYTCPSWNPAKGSIKYNWKLEEISNGVSLGERDISKKGYYTIGRLPEEVCDISLENNSISRQHAVIQHRNNGNVYLFDLESTHGSFINKNKIKPRIYAQIIDGDIIKFGESKRLFVLQGGPPPPEIPDPKMQKIITTPNKSIEKEEEEEVKNENKLPESVFTGNAEELKSFMKKKVQQN